MRRPVPRHKVGTGKTILKYRKGRIIYAQGEEADRIFYIQSGKGKVTVVFRARQRSGGRDMGNRAVFWRGMSEWSGGPRWNREGNGGVRCHLNHAEGDAGG